MNTNTTTRYPSDPALSQYFASIAHLPFKERLSRSRADLPQQEKSGLRLSREEVTAKYAPKPDPLWTADREEAFFLNLDTVSRRTYTRMSGERYHLVKEFARDTLHAKRISDKYISTLGSILGSFATADKDGSECLVPRSAEQHGDPRTIRTIQTQMFNAGLLVKEVRTQGHGFIGSVFVYSPRAPFRHRAGNAASIEADYRAFEGEHQYSVEQLPVNLTPEDVPF